MRKSRTQFVSLLLFLAVLVFLLTNGFRARIFAQDAEEDVFRKIQPIGIVLQEIQSNYVLRPNMDEMVEGAITGMMNSLDEHSSYISARDFQRLIEDTSGQFEGIGVKIFLDEDKNIVIQQPIPGTPAAKAGVMAGDLIYKIDGLLTKGMALDEAANKIRGPRGTPVTLSLVRRLEINGELEADVLEVEIKRGAIPVESIDEARVFENGVGYMRISDFKERTAQEMADKIKGFEKEGLKALIVDLRWNPGGLLDPAREVCELFLPENTLVTYTKTRNRDGEGLAEDRRYYTQRPPVVPLNMPLIVMVNGLTASSSEIVTGALQFHERAIVVGSKSFGKGSVQTLIQLPNPPGAALRLTTALYYTPAEVSIHHQGILPDVNVPVTFTESRLLQQQLLMSDRDSTDGTQNHGLNGNAGAEAAEDAAKEPAASSALSLLGKEIEDVQLRRALDIIEEDGVFANLVAKYHKDPTLTQVAASEDEILKRRTSFFDEEEPAVEEEGTTEETEVELAPVPEPAAVE